MKWSEVAQSCPTLFDPMDSSQPGSSIHGIFQAKILECVAISFSRGSSWPRDRIWVSCIGGRHFNLWATREAPVFPVVMYECENWTIKKTEHWRIDAFELWCWRRLLRAPWTVRRSNQSILKETSPGCSLEGMMLKLKLQYFGHLMGRVHSLEKLWCWEGLGAGGEGDDRGWDGWMASPTQWTGVWVSSRS